MSGVDRSLAAPGSCQGVFPVANYDLDLTLSSGQAFRWRKTGPDWEGVVGSRWVRLRNTGGSITAETAEPVDDWDWLRHYLQLDTKLECILSAFPPDPFMRQAVRACAGLRLLRQDPWECLASFILSSTKQIRQIEQIIDQLSCRLGMPVAVPSGHPPVRCFPSAQRVASSTETELRACKMGFRAPYLLATARLIDQGVLRLNTLADLPYEEARRRLIALPGVGDKIANCVLLFAAPFQEAFPMDVWIRRVLQEHYFPRQRPTLCDLQHFIRKHFGPWSGYAQQYLFHYARVIKPREARRSGRHLERRP
jgi:N-glycosylase/DNA lyase